MKLNLILILLVALSVPGLAATPTINMVTQDEARSFGQDFNALCRKHRVVAAFFVKGGDTLVHSGGDVEFEGWLVRKMGFVREGK